ncbi:MAG: YceI family protein [Calditrichaeota bacterium]|nr:YceI family protein [Calditrichota bacterium]
MMTIKPTNHPRRLIAKAALLALLTAGGLQAKPLTLKVEAGPPNLITFTSRAPLETIVGKTAQISGSLRFDPADLTAEASAVLIVQMATLNTDNRVRDGHMRDNHLHTDIHPISRFTLTRLIPSEIKAMPSGATILMKAEGEFLCHGVSRQITPDIKAKWDEVSGRLDVTATFKVTLADYGIPRPQFLVMKLEETQDIEVKFVATKSE